MPGIGKPPNLNNTQHGFSQCMVQCFRMLQVGFLIKRHFPKFKTTQTAKIQKKGQWIITDKQQKLTI